MHPVGTFVLVLAFYHSDPSGVVREYSSVTQIRGFRSWELCEAAGMEAQARLNNKKISEDALGLQQLDFVCLYQGKK